MACSAVSGPPRFLGSAWSGYLKEGLGTYSSLASKVEYRVQVRPASGRGLLESAVPAPGVTPKTAGRCSCTCWQGRIAVTRSLSGLMPVSRASGLPVLVRASLRRRSFGVHFPLLEGFPGLFLRGSQCSALIPFQHGELREDERDPKDRRTEDNAHQYQWLHEGQVPRQPARQT